MTDSLANLLLDHPFADERDLLCTVDGTMTAGAARAEARETAVRLTDAGIEPGHGVAVQLPSGPELVTAMAGIWLAGAVFVPLNDRSPEAEVHHVLDTIRPATLLNADGLRVLDDPLRHDPEVAFVTWTSGTTGPPKAILQSHGGYLELLDRVLRPLRGGGGLAGATRSRPRTSCRCPWRSTPASTTCASACAPEPRSSLCAASPPRTSPNSSTATRSVRPCCRLPPW